jgi:hypothetical protein
MSDYLKALNEGFEAAKKADLAKEEITEILNKFRDDILAGSEGNLLIEVKRLEEPLDAYEAFMTRSVLHGATPKKTYLALTAINPKASTQSYKDLAKWKRSKDGYPCSLTYNQQEHQFEDRLGLEQGLAELLRDPSIGEQLYILTRQK